MSSSVSAALDKWREINLPSLQAAVSELPDQLLGAQRDSLVSRRKLAESTKEFKKQSDETKLETFKGLLKAYQSEVDSLTKRAQSAENAFLRMWKAPSGVEGAPDPYPLLEVLVDQAIAIEDAEKLKADHQALQQSYDALLGKTESASSIESERDSLQARLAEFESSLEQRIKERTISIEREWEAKLDERLRNHQEQEAESKKEVSRLKGQVRELKAREDELVKRSAAGKDATDGQADAYGPGASASTAEVEMTLEELERAQRRIADLETRNEALRAQVEAAKHSSVPSAASSALESERAALQEENRKLKALIDRREQSQANIKSQEESRRKELERQLQSRDKELALFKGKLERQQDYDEIKRELLILRSIEFGDEDRAEGGAAGEPDEADKGLEAALLRKTRKLQDEVTSLRVQNTELGSNARQSAEEAKSLKAELARLKSLNQRLENDLLSLNGPAGPPGKPAQSDGPAPYKLGGAAGSAATASEGSAAASTAGPNSAGDSSSSILPIITSQRDRFRSRNAELEDELRKQAQVLSELRQEVAKLQADNLGLYEKLRYLQTYGADGAGGGNGEAGSSSLAMGTAAARTDASGAYPAPSGINFAQRREERYRQKYEERMDPFQAFRGREQSRALATLNPLERMLHTLTRLALGDRRVRIGFMVYALAIHVLVFFMLFDFTARSGAMYGHNEWTPVKEGDMQRLAGAGAGAGEAGGA